MKRRQIFTALSIVALVLLSLSYFVLSNYAVYYYKLPWAIGVYEFHKDFSVTELGDNPVLSKDDIIEHPSFFVADPFVIEDNDVYYMFYEAGFAVKKGSKGVIALAQSNDGIKWQHDRIILEDSVSISFPVVYKENGEYYMTIEGRKANNVRLYKANSFPYEWDEIGILIEESLSDPVIKKHNEIYYLIASRPLTYDEVYIYYSQNIEGPYFEHTLNPVVRSDKKTARNAGNIFEVDDKLYRPVQDCSAQYGEKVRLMEIKELSPNGFEEQEVESSPILVGSGSGWSGGLMHTFNLYNSGGGGYVSYC